MNQIFAVLALIALTLTKNIRVQAGFDKDQSVADYLNLRERVVAEETKTAAVEIDVDFFEVDKCTDESVIKDLSANRSFHTEFPCTGNRDYVVPWGYDITMNDGQKTKLVIEKSDLLNRYLNGNVMFMVNGTIKSPGDCAGDTFLSVAIMTPESQTDCTTDGVTGHKMIYSQIVVTGNCESICSFVSGTTHFSKAVTNEESDDSSESDDTSDDSGESVDDSDE